MEDMGYITSEMCACVCSSRQGVLMEDMGYRCLDTRVGGDRLYHWIVLCVSHKVDLLERARRTL